MVKISKYIKNNLLGIAVAFGVCSFLYESFISRSYDFTFTKYAGFTVFIIAVYTRHKDNLAFQAKKDQKFLKGK